MDSSDLLSTIVPRRRGWGLQSDAIRSMHLAQKMGRELLETNVSRLVQNGEDIPSS